MNQAMLEPGPHGELNAYRERCRVLEDRLCDLQLELARVQRLARVTRRLLDSCQLEAMALQGAHNHLQDRYDELSIERQQLLASVTALGRQVDALHASWSWRLTAPLRFALAWLRGY